ncbi:PilZ domain-containing protein [Thermodesulfobacteriota bacterium]
MGPENRRKYYRAKVVAPARWQVLNEKDIELVKKGMGISIIQQRKLRGPIDELAEQVTPGSDEEQLYRCMQFINNKLDFIIEQLVFNTGDEKLMRNDVVEISGSGLKFLSQIRLNEGSFLKMSLIMPETFHYQMEFITEVIRVQEHGEGYIVAAQIIEIDEETRDAIIKVIFQKQREEIRKDRLIQGDESDV